jgi:hypothetical protein
MEGPEIWRRGRGNGRRRGGKSNTKSNEAREAKQEWYKNPEKYQNSEKNNSTPRK